MGKRKLSTKAQELLSKQLYQAIRDNDIEAVKAVIELGVDVNAKSEYGFTPLIFACSVGQVECVKALLKHKDIDVNAREKNGITALMFAYNDGNKKIIKLIEKHLEKLEQKEAQQDTSETQPEQAQEEVLPAEIAQENEQKEQIKPILKREDSKLIEMYKGGKLPFETLMNLCQDNPVIADEVWKIEQDKIIT